MACEVIWEELGVWGRYHGHLTVEDVFALIQAIPADPRGDRIRYRSGDFTDVESVSEDVHDLEKIAAIDWASNEHARRSMPLITVAVVPDAVGPMVRPLLERFREVSEQPGSICGSRAEAREQLADALGRERLRGVRLLGEVLAERR